jgi:hypothetical protein
MNKRAVRAIARKDIISIASNIQVWLPMLIIPLIFSVVYPIGLAFAIRATGNEISGDFGEILDKLEKLPLLSSGSLRRTLDSLVTDQQRAAYLMFNYFMSPFFLMIPLMAASTISVDSFVGKRKEARLKDFFCRRSTCEACSSQRYWPRSCLLSQSPCFPSFSLLSAQTRLPGPCSAGSSSPT